RSLRRRAFPHALTSSSRARNARSVGCASVGKDTPSDPLQIWRRVRLWATHDAGREDVDVAGDREGLRALAAAASQAEPLDLILDAPPGGWEDRGRPLEATRIKPPDRGDPQISFPTIEPALWIAGAPAAVMRIVGGSLTMLAEGPGSRNGVPSHVHLDPTT